ncbi:type II secretion system F family protein [Senegalimassilia faecalis]|uniref:Type II secretion system F family protein n=1 Tax=Senegalimassilia faecalis TaxID=2509433 RepID=A0A4Q2JYQ6_9ACTN|nr:type II secretion system F family protein [Senegalimassilia faecalis]RXZ54086.1 type II secretion system F family protein [Senegalimassilia faecalis]
MDGFLFAAIAFTGIAAGLVAYEVVCAWCGAKSPSAVALSPSSSEAPASSPRSAAKSSFVTIAQRLSVAVNTFAPMTRDEAGSTRDALRRAGMGVEPETWRAVVAVMIGASAALCFAACVLFAVPSVWSIALTVGAAAFGHWAAGRYVAFRQNDRRRSIEACLPDAMELLAVALAAGSPIEQCFREVSASLKGPISEELRLVDQEVNLLGHSRTEALEHFAQRCASQEVSVFVGQITQAIDQGSSVSEGLAAQALLAREQAQAMALERIRKMPTKLDIVLSACFLPPTVILVLVPTVVKLLTFLSGGMV